MRFSYYDRSRGCGCAFSCIPNSVIILITSCFSCLRGCSGSGTEAWSALPCPSLFTVYHLFSLCLQSWWKHTWTLARGSCLLLPGCSLPDCPHFSAWNFKGRKSLSARTLRFVIESWDKTSAAELELPFRHLCYAEVWLQKWRKGKYFL